MDRPPPGYAHGFMATEGTGTAELLGGRYRLGQVIARGGMGTVWRAHDERLQRAVAVKEVLLTGDRGDAPREDARTRFLREAHAAARVSHPSVVAVYDVLEEGDRLYLVMELVDAPTLAEVVAANGPLRPAEVAELGLRLVDALGAAHAQGIVHRDLKPSNVLMFGGGRAPKLADFGIAASLHDPRITATGLVLGSPSFMAPEQAQGQSATPATDLWGLGATLYFAAEGVCAFERGSAMASVQAVVHEEPNPPMRAGHLRPLLLSLLAKDPAQRPALADVQAQLTAPQDDEPTGPLTPIVEATVAVPVVDSTSTQVFPRLPNNAAALPVPRPRRRTSPALLAALAILALVAVAVWAATAGDGGQGAIPALGATEQSVPPTTAPPLEWAAYQDPATGFTIEQPVGWEVVTDGTRTDFRDPATGAFVRVDWTDSPGDDAVAAWESDAEALAAVGMQHSMEVVTVSDQFGLALFFQAPADQWEPLQPVFTRFRDSFTPPAEPPPSPEPKGKGKKDKDDDD